MAILAAVLAGAIWWVTGGSHGETDASPEHMDRHTAVASSTVVAKAQVKPVLGLMGTLPIYWGEVAGIDEVLQGDRPPHWARTALERRYRLEPLDSLADERGVARLDYLILAQPRALSGPENVVLDQWVREGGRVLLFADPFLTGESRFHVGDRRRPQDVVLVSPILARWGLELLFDQDQPDGQRNRSVAGLALPVHLAGHFRLRPPAGGGESRCSLLDGGLVAECLVGKGAVFALADATVLEDGAHEKGRSESVLALARRAFDSPASNPGK